MLLGFNCCCSKCGCLRGVSDSLKVTLSGWTDGTPYCTQCDESMGSFIVTSEGPISGSDQCRFQSYFATYPCLGFGSTGIAIDITIADVGGNTAVTIVVTYGPPGVVHTITYARTFSGRVDCLSWVNEPIPYASDVPAGPDICEYADPYGSIDDALLTSL